MEGPEKGVRLERADFDTRRDEERLQRLSSFLLHKRQCIDPNAAQVGPFTRRENRIGRPVTQEEIAEALEVSRQWYAALETGSTIRPSVTLLDRIAAVFELGDDERMLLFGLAIREVGACVQVPGTILDGPAPVTAYAAAIRSPAKIEVAADTLARVREQYLVTGTVDGMPARSRIIASWDRCRALGVDPTQKKTPRCHDLEDRRAANQRVLCTSGPIVAHLADQLAGTGYVTVVADAQGRILEIVGDLEVQRHLAKDGFEPGGDLSEAACGTNAIGTAIADRRPLQLFGPEHYCAATVALTGTAAPIYDPTTRTIAGVLDITASYRLVRQHLIGVVMQATLEIEERLALH
jgi:transcriptional regulator with XRE-family HTH domain